LRNRAAFSLSGRRSFSVWSSVFLDLTVTIAIVTRKSVKFGSPPPRSGLNRPAEAGRQNPAMPWQRALDVRGPAHACALRQFGRRIVLHTLPQIFVGCRAELPRILRSWAWDPSKMAAGIAFQDGFLILVELLWPPLPDQVPGELAALGP
jgi:hypothetical protein